MKFERIEIFDESHTALLLASPPRQEASEDALQIHDGKLLLGSEHHFLLTRGELLLQNLNLLCLALKFCHESILRRAQVRREGGTLGGTEGGVPWTAGSS